MTIIDDITRDLDWRETELGSLKILIKQPNLSPKQKQVLLRAAWAMLYAHYEGFSKFCLTMFYGEISRRIDRCELLPRQTKAFALYKTMQMMRGLSHEKAVVEMENVFTVTLKKGPEFPEVDTKSNLWPKTLEMLLEQADISSAIVEKHVPKIKTLVARRNGIAHGKEDVINDVDYYLTFEEAIYEIMYQLVYLIDERLNDHPYRLP